MKLKSLLLSCILLLSPLAIADIKQDETEAKAAMVEMIALIDDNNFKDLVANYAYLPEDKKAGLLAFIEAQPATTEPNEGLLEMKAALNKALTITPTQSDNELTFRLKDSRPIIFVKENNRWLLKN